MATLLGTIVEKDGMLCLQTSPGCWYPLDGNSGVAQKFRETFTKAQRSDLGKRIYYSGGIIQMENDTQKAARLDNEPGPDGLTRKEWRDIQDAVSNSDLPNERRLALLDKIGAKA